MQDLGGTANGADLHDRVEYFDVAQAHYVIPSKGLFRSI
jgi:hypothetical protein